MPVPGKLLLKFALFVAILAAGFLALQLPGVRDQLVLDTLTTNLDNLRRHPAAAPVFVVATALLTAVGLPGTVPVVAGGAVFGALSGGLLAFTGMVAGAALSFALAHTLARDFVRHLLGSRLERFERQLQRLGFWTLLRLRFLPMPYAIVNYGVCLAGVRFSTYIYSTALALLPICLTYAYFASSLLGAAGPDRAGVLRNLALAILFLFVLSFVPPRLSAWWRRSSRRDVPAPPPPREGRS